MNEQDQKNKQEPPKNQLGGKKPASTYKKTLSRKWISPAMFVAAAAIIVTVMWLYQGNDQKTSTTVTPPDSVQTGQGGDKPIEETVKPVPGETAAWPVANVADVSITRGYFDSAASAAEQEASLVEQNNTFTGNTGIDLARADDQPFDVMAVLSGKVSNVEEHPTNGTVVEIAHGNGLVSVYQSLSSANVKVGDEVKQSTVIGKAGRNDLQKELGVHLHFALLKNNEHVNPIAQLPTDAPKLQVAMNDPQPESSEAPAAGDAAITPNEQESTEQADQATGAEDTGASDADASPAPDANGGDSGDAAQEDAE